MKDNKIAIASLLLSTLAITLVFLQFYQKEYKPYQADLMSVDQFYLNPIELVGKRYHVYGYLYVNNGVIDLYPDKEFSKSYSDYASWRQLRVVFPVEKLIKNCNYTRVVVSAWVDTAWGVRMLDNVSAISNFETGEDCTQPGKPIRYLVPRTEGLDARLSEIEFTDENLALCVKDTSVNFVSDLYSLACFGREIVNVAGIEKLTALDYLNLGYNSIKNFDIDFPKDNKLSYVVLHDNPISCFEIDSLREKHPNTRFDKSGCL